MKGLLLHDPVWLLAVVPAVLAWAWRLRRRRRRAVLFSSAELLRGLPGSWRMRLARGLPALTLAALLLGCLALARPQQGTEEFRINTEGVAILLAVDRSGSMEAMDFELDGRQARRIDVARRATRDFVAGSGDLPGREDDLVGLVAFGGFAEALCPPTLDHGALLQILKDVDTPQPAFDDRGRLVNESFLQEESATAIGDALALAVERLRNVEARSRVVVLLSDGENTAGAVDPLDAMEVAREFGVRIYAIGVGSTGMAPFARQDRFGRRMLQYGQVRLDEELLQEIARQTGGRYFNVRSTEALEKVYGEIDRLEKSAIQGRIYTQYRELYQALLLPALALLGAGALLRTTWFRRMP